MPEAKFLLKVAEAQKYLDAFARTQPNRSLDNLVALELGTGWFPIIPAAHFLSGIAKTWAYDIAPLPNTERVRRMAELFIATFTSGELQKVLPTARPERLAAFQELLRRLPSESVETALTAIGVHFQVRDGRATGLPDASVELIYSSGVLHHIPQPVLREMFVEFRRVARPGAVMTHRLHMIDQFSFIDPSITVFNSLRYPAWQWRWLDSPMTPQNRLRLPDYRALITAAGFELLKEDNRVGLEADLRKVRLAPEFSHYRKEELLVIESFVTTRRSV